MYLPLSKLVPERKPTRRDTSNTAEQMYKFVAIVDSVGWSGTSVRLY